MTKDAVPVIPGALEMRRRYLYGLMNADTRELLASIVREIGEIADRGEAYTQQLSTQPLNLLKYEVRAMAELLRLSGYAVKVKSPWSAPPYHDVLTVKW